MARSTSALTHIFSALALCVACATAGYAAAAAAEHAHRGKVIRIGARRFAFSPNDITLKRGEAVTLEFRAEDVLMGFNTPGLATRADLPPQQIVRLHLRPDRVGTFPFLCDVFCGSGHENMTGVIHVVEEPEASS